MGASEASAADRSQWLKNTTHINVVFTAACNTELLRDLLGWLNLQSTSPATDEQLERHLNQLERRREGLDGLPEMWRISGQMRAVFTTPRHFMRSYTFAEFDLGAGRLIVSLDLLNAGGELGFPDEVGDVAEIFWVGAKEEAAESSGDRERRRQTERARVRQLVRDIVRDFDVRFVFGGHVSFVSRYVRWLQRSRSHVKPRRALPWEFLWPLTYLPECSLDEAALKGLPVHYAERVASGALIEVFEDLHMGYQDDYVDAAHALGLRAVWELKP